MEITDKKIPEKIKRRLTLFKMFYPLDRNQERRWGRIFDSEFKDVCAFFKEAAEKNNYEQKSIGKQLILWKDIGTPNVEALFYFVWEPSDLDQIQGIFKRIQKHRPAVSYGIIHQKKDGDGVFDIFRFSRFSYLEHCNRVRSTKRQKNTEKKTDLKS